jgi:hypothetical protein
MLHVDRKFLRNIQPLLSDMSLEIGATGISPAFRDQIYVFCFIDVPMGTEGWEQLAASIFGFGHE